MIRDITIGQYYPADSLIHRLDPRTKIIGTLAYLVSLFIVNNWGYIVCTAYLAALILISKVPFKFMVKGLKALLVLLILTMAINMFLTPGRILFQWKFIHITEEGLKSAGLMGLRLVYLILGASLLTLTTTPNKLTDGLECLLSPLKVFKVPVHEIAMMMSIALRFIPILLDETDKIMKAQSARGADFETGGIFKRIRAMVPLFVPLFVSAFRRANDLALAMEARCYHGGENRTQMKPLRYNRRDYIAYGIMAAALALVIVLRVILHW